MSGHLISLNKIKLWYETFGNPEDSPLLLIMGNSAQGVMWPDTFCEKLAAQKHYVLRFDHRDTGLSSCVDFNENPYDLFDLTQDILGLMDKLQIKKAHLVGLSMGGSLAQLLAAHFPSRVLSLTLLMTSPDLSVKNDAFMGKDTSQAALPPPKKEFVSAVIELNKKIPASKSEQVKQLVENWRLANGGKAAFDEVYWLSLVELAFSRQEFNPEARNLKFANHGNHSKAQMATAEPNLTTLKLISSPTLIIHGLEDPIFPPAHAEALAQSISNSKLLLIAQMGHALNPLFFEELISAINDHTSESATPF
jgi:pimeloyl-ACP methyl ester carboxylesterase